MKKDEKELKKSFKDFPALEEVLGRILISILVCRFLGSSRREGKHLDLSNFRIILACVCLSKIPVRIRQVQTVYTFLIAIARIQNIYIKLVIVWKLTFTVLL